MSKIILIPKDQWIFENGMKFPYVQCPICGSGLLGDTAPHGIVSDGRIYNSVICKSNYRDKKTQQIKECTFHEYIKLESWIGIEIPRSKNK